MSCTYIPLPHRHLHASRVADVGHWCLFRFLLLRASSLLAECGSGESASGADRVGCGGNSYCGCGCGWECGCCCGGGGGGWGLGMRCRVGCAWRNKCTSCQQSVGNDVHLATQSINSCLNGPKTVEIYILSKTNIVTKVEWNACFTSAVVCDRPPALPSGRRRGGRAGGGGSTYRRMMLPPRTPPPAGTESAPACHRRVTILPTFRRYPPQKQKYSKYWIFKENYVQAVEKHILKKTHRAFQLHNRYYYYFFNFWHKTHNLNPC